MIINSRFLSLNNYSKSEPQLKTKAPLNTLKADTVSFKAYQAYKSSKEPIINGNDVIFSLATISESSRLATKLIGKDIKLDHYAHVTYNDESLFKINSLEMGNNSEIRLMNTNRKMEIDAQANIEDNCSIVQGLGDYAAIFLTLNGTQNTIGNNFKSDNIFVARGNISIKDGLKCCQLMNKSGNITIGKNAEVISNISCKYGKLTIGATDKVGMIAARNLVCAGDVTIGRLDLIDSVETSNNSTLHVKNDINVQNESQTNSKREVSLKNTIVDGDLIVYKESGVSQLNLDNVKIKGNLILEDKSTKVVSANGTEIARTITPKY